MSFHQAPCLNVVIDAFAQFLLFLGQSLNVIEICRVNDHFPIGLIND
jgi:hypothetical protein